MYIAFLPIGSDCVVLCSCITLSVDRKKGYQKLAVLHLVSVSVRLDERHESS